MRFPVEQAENGMKFRQISDDNYTNGTSPRAGFPRPGESMCAGNCLCKWMPWNEAEPGSVPGGPGNCDDGDKTTLCRRVATWEEPGKFICRCNALKHVPVIPIICEECLGGPGTGSIPQPETPERKCMCMAQLFIWLGQFNIEENTQEAIDCCYIRIQMLQAWIQECGESEGYDFDCIIHNMRCGCQAMECHKGCFSSSGLAWCARERFMRCVRRDHDMPHHVPFTCEKEFEKYYKCAGKCGRIYDRCTDDSCYAPPDPPSGPKDPTHRSVTQKIKVNRFLGEHQIKNLYWYGDVVNSRGKLYIANKDEVFGFSPEHGKERGWEPFSSTSTMNFTNSDVAPEVPNEGDHWFNNSAGKLYIYISDQDTSQWVEL